MGSIVRRGDIHLVDLEPVQSSEANQVRPAVIVSNDRANASALRHGRGVLTVIPLTSNVSRIYPFQVLLEAAATGTDRDSKAQAEQVRSVDAGRLGPRIGRVPPPLMAQIDDALRLHLDL
ncbi:type II toxin-antitoxin system PemK/MazF family toxin [Brachybacterium sp. Marseille-Q7125]|uniref:type II toxin-antitoxin system PemK/MazF family toxin n=1 Tax=Brachybacterium sp. Marseille-Q7125 TaxID=2932815 RepID=UPI00248B4FA7|nr:type II toxin-antitoxin system PemK/MazF family toxin [Brachybacterium sp. Marseille-Q7125]